MFASPLLLLAAPALAAAAWGLHAWAGARRRAVAAALGRPATLARSADEAPARRGARAALRAAALALIGLALAGPRWGVELVETRAEARQVVIAVDASLSMLTPDASPNRLERAKSAMSLLIEELRGDRLGVVAFAGSAQILCPLTQDADAARDLLGALEAGSVSPPGTAVGEAIRLSASMLGRYPGGKAVVLLTDGEDHRTDPLGAAREAAASGVRVYALGIGTPEGEPIPVETGGYKKDAAGKTVVSRLDEKTLAEAAALTGGAYRRATPGGDEVGEIAGLIRGLDAARGLSGEARRWRNRYAWPAALAFLLLLAEFLLAVRPPEASFLQPPVPASRRAAAAAALLLALAAAPARALTGEMRLREGNRLYGKERYEEALERYDRARRSKPKDARPAFNAGDALYRLSRLDDAADLFAALAARPDLPPATRAHAWYNLGNARLDGGDFAGAAEAYRRSLALAPRDPDARRNLAFALRAARNPPPKRQGPKNQPEPKPDPKSEDKKDGGGQGQGDGKTPPPRTRPQDQLTREEAERVLNASEDREKEARRKAAQAAARRAGAPPSGEDW